MIEAILIFTFSPIQPFIAEARRTADLFVASRILVKLAQAAGKALMKHGTLVYPAALKEDMPNKIVAVIPWGKAKIAADEGIQALLQEWERIADTAERKLEEIEPFPDNTWQKIWQRQTAHLWEIYWSASSLAGRSYTEAYREAERALAGTKRTRAFENVEEHDFKDSLSGRREALHTASLNAKEYWAKLSKDKEVLKKLRSKGRERLDAIGAIKRFCELSQKSFPSTSTIAATDFLIKARHYLTDYRQAVVKLLGTPFDSVRQDNGWPYDGDLLFMDTLTQHRLEDSYGVSAPLSQELIWEAQEKLREVYRKANSKPLLYYAVIVLDGDDMGKKIDNCLKEENPEESHRNFSIKLREFSSDVSAIVDDHSGHVIYAGGDDVVVLAPLLKAFALAQALNDKFQESTRCTASAGIAIVHHLYPLGKSMQAAREAERSAKQAPKKSSVCIKVLKRSGSAMTVRSRWQEFNRFNALSALFMANDDQKAALSGKFAYDVAQTAMAFPESDEMFKAELTRQLKRHRNTLHPDPLDVKEWAEHLFDWSVNLPGKTLELGNWLILARFIGKGGSE